MPETGGVYEKLLYDQSTFPVTHKNRFNEDGSGKGKGKILAINFLLRLNIILAQHSFVL